MDERLHGHENPDESPDVLAAVDRRLDPLVPTGPAPVTDLLARGRARRTRRRGLQAGLAAAVAVAVAAVGSAVVADGRSKATPPVATQTPTMPEGMRTVGLDGLVVDVPADWVLRAACGSAANADEESVTFAPASTTDCTAPSVTLTTGRYFANTGTTTPESRGGLDVYVNETPPCDSVEGGEGADACAVLDPGISMVVPEASRRSSAADRLPSAQTVTVTGPDRVRIANSVRPAPAGYVGVPDVAGLGLDDATRVLADAGLDFSRKLPLYVVGVTDPAAGSVVPVGTFVDLPRRQDDEVTPVPDGYRLVDHGGVAVAIPEDWVGCPMVEPGGAGPGFGVRSRGGCDAESMISLDSFPDTELDEAPVTRLNGLRVQVLPGCTPSPYGRCDERTHLRVRTVDQGVTVRIASPSTVVRETALDSIRAAAGSAD